MRITKDLSIPKGLNLDFLDAFISDRQKLKLILDRCSKDRKERIVIFPSKKTLKKLLCHYYGKRVEMGAITWEQAMKKLKGEFEYLKEIGITRQQVKNLFIQREKEIKRENNGQ